MNDNACRACDAGLPIVWCVQSKKYVHAAPGLSVTPCIRREAQETSFRRSRAARDKSPDLTVKWELVWERDLGDGRVLVMERGDGNFRTTLVGFRGVGPTRDAALDDLLARMHDYCADADDGLERALAPGGDLQEKFRQVQQLVDQNIRNYRRNNST